ncbi:MAG TPA: tetratricopeptide repeat protein, partial [Puia sp.]|nr:tetratricopeptide repeat protein [Puia sp.]
TKALRKQQGITEEEQQGSSNFSFNNTAAAPDLFGSSSDNAEWYFYNPSVKSKGFNDFRSKWGNRPNVDNWFLSSLASKQKIGINKTGPNQGMTSEIPAKPVAAPVSAESLLENIPLTPEKMKKSMDSVENAWYKLGKSYQDDLPDYRAAIEAFDSLLEKFPGTNYREETLFNLYYCYKKIGDEDGAARVLQLLNDKYPSGKYVHLISNPVSENPENKGKLGATLLYEKIYTAFIEGNFDEALLEKKTADSLYGEKYWTPQLLYIEAVYFVHQRSDSAAMAELRNIQMKFPGTSMAIKAKNLLDVLGRRKQIEDYLTNLKVERAKEDAVIDENSKNLGLENNPLPTAMYDKSRMDSLLRVKQKPKTDTSQAAKKIPGFSTLFAYTPDKPHSVAILMIKIDPVYVTETRNAFNRYNRETYYNKTFEINNVAVDDTIKLVLINGFENADAAIDYMEKAKKLAPRDIIPWLPAGKYSFLIITDQNLDILKNNKDTQAYKKFLAAYYPGRF